MRISDWSSDVCSSDLRTRGVNQHAGIGSKTRRLVEIARRQVLPATQAPKTAIHNGYTIYVSAALCHCHLFAVPGNRGTGIVIAIECQSGRITAGCGYRIELRITAAIGGKHYELALRGPSLLRVNRHKIERAND